MQGQRNTIQFFPEAFECDHASSSSSTSLDQQVYWNNALSSEDAWNAPDHLLSRNEANMSYRDAFNHETESLSGWNMVASNSNEHTMNQDNHDASEMENVWIHPSSVNPRAGSSYDERRLQAANILSLDSMAIDHNIDQILQGQFCPSNSTPTSSANNADCNAEMTGVGQAPQTGICTFYNPFPSEVEHPRTMGSFYSHGFSACNEIGHFSEDADVRSGSLLDGRRLSGKRKNIEGVPGPSSGSPGNISFQQTESSLQNTTFSRNFSSGSSNIYLDNLSSVRPPEEHLNPTSTNGVRDAVPECLSLINVAGSAESSHRNFRSRTILSQHADPSGPNLWSLGNTSMNNSVWSPHHSSSLLIPVNQHLEARAAIPGPRSHSQSHLQVIPGLPQMVYPSLWNGVSRIATSSNSQAMSGERLASLAEEASLRGLSRNSIPELPMFFPSAEVRHIVEDHANWRLSYGNISIPANVASTSLVGSTSGGHPSVSPTWPPHQSPHNHYRQTSSEFIYRPFPASVSDPSGQLSNYFAQHPGRSGSSDISPLPVPGPRAHQQPFLRSGFLMSRRSNVTGTPLASRTSAAARDGRNMIICEHIRNALDRMRRSVGVRLEDVLILDQSAIFEAADLHDRHRDLRLDIDNMSYEELLALEERIGDVNTGLSEEVIQKNLKQQKYTCILSSSGGAEPCCICQEEYLGGEDLGALDCGHDFHVACIKQWLAHKNICPICKTPAFAT